MQWTQLITPAPEALSFFFKLLYKKIDFIMKFSYVVSYISYYHFPMYVSYLSLDSPHSCPPLSTLMSFLFPNSSPSAFMSHTPHIFKSDLYLNLDFTYERKHAMFSSLSLSLCLFLF